jgi:hypothetical protein
MTETSPPSAEADRMVDAARTYAERIVSGTVSPYEGARYIWWTFQLRLPAGDHRLDPFVYWASEYEDTNDHDRKSLCDHAIRTAASSLMSNGSAM